MGFRGVEEKKSLDILLSEQPVELKRLQNFCLRFAVPGIYRSQVCLFVVFRHVLSCRPCIPGVATGSGCSACSLQQHRVGLDTAKRAVEGAEVGPAGDKEDNELYRSQRGLLYRLVVGDETTQGGNIQYIRYVQYKSMTHRDVF